MERNWFDQVNGVAACGQGRCVVARARADGPTHGRRQGQIPSEELLGSRALERTFAFAEAAVLEAEGVVLEDFVRRLRTLRIVHIPSVRAGLAASHCRTHFWRRRIISAWLLRRV